MPESLRDFERFCKTLRVEDGSPASVFPWERPWLKPLFEGVTENVAVIPKKNVKTTRMAALTLYHLRMVRGAEAVIGATSAKQAGILYRQMVKLVQQSGLTYEFDVKPGYLEIRSNRGRAVVYAADAATADGVIPTLALYDELHRANNGDLYAVFRDGLGPRGGRMGTISTAGWNMLSPLGRLRATALNMATFRRDGRLKSAFTDGFSYHELSLEDGDDLHDMRVVKKVNPAPWHTIESLQRRHDSPTTTPAQWARFAAGIWTAGEEPWLQADQWDRLCVDVGRVEEGEEVAGCMIYGHGAAVVLAALRDDGSVRVHSRILTGDPSLGDLERLVLELAGRYRIRDLAYDVALQRSAEELETHGVPMLEHPLSPQRLSQATATVARLLDESKMGHDGDPLLRQHVLAGVTVDGERGYRLRRTPETNGLIAMAIAAHLATQQPAAVPVYVAI